MVESRDLSEHEEHKERAIQNTIAHGILIANEIERKLAAEEQHQALLEQQAAYDRIMVRIGIMVAAGIAAVVIALVCRFALEDYNSPEANQRRTRAAIQEGLRKAQTADSGSRPSSAAAPPAMTTAPDIEKQIDALRPLSSTEEAALRKYLKAKQAPEPANPAASAAPRERPPQDPKRSPGS